MGNDCDPLDGVEPVSRACVRAAIIINATITRDDPTCKLLNRPPPPLGSFFFGEGEDYRGGHPSIEPRSRGWNPRGMLLLPQRVRESGRRATTRNREISV